MTCIVGIAQNNKVYIGGDSGAIGGTTYEIRKSPKVFIKGEFLYGYAGSFRLGNILQYEFKEPKIKGDNIHKYLATDYFKALMKCYKSVEFDPNPKNAEVNAEVDGGCSFMIGIRGQLFTMSSEDHHVVDLLRNYNAIGCGGDQALGALFATKEDTDPVKRINTALKASAEFSYIYEPFTILSV